jgi:hypothetical protein
MHASITSVIGFRSKFCGNSIDIIWEFFGNFIRILWQFFRNSIGNIWQFFMTLAKLIGYLNMKGIDGRKDKNLDR